jgi:hypothetical protein
VAAGQPVEATFGAWPGQVFKGTVEAVDAQVVENTRAFTVRAKLANPDGRMVPGMFANIAVVAGEAARLVTLPQTAVTYSLYGDSVYVVVPQPDAQAGTTDTGEPKLQVERRFVRLGEARGGRVAVAEGVKEGEEVVIRVADTGIGIERDHLAQVFELFTQIDATMDRAEGGLGIGLSLVKRLVELHDGTVSAHSAGRGCGTSFVVRLPRFEAALAA